MHLSYASSSYESFMKMHKDGGAEAPPILVHLRSYDPHTRGGLRPRSLVRSTGPRSASFARCAVVAGAFVRSGHKSRLVAALASRQLCREPLDARGRICRQSSSTGAGVLGGRHADRRRTGAATDAANGVPQAPADARDGRG